MSCKREALGDKVVIYDCERTLWEEIGGDIEVAGGAGAGCEGGWGEAMGRDVG